MVTGMTMGHGSLGGIADSLFVLPRRKSGIALEPRSSPIAGMFKYVEFR